MCGRYALYLRPSQVRRMLQDNDMQVDDYPADEGEGAPRQSYNFAPGYHGIVYRADVPDWGAGPRRSGGGAQDREARDDEPAPTAAAAHNADSSEEHSPREVVHYKLQSMKWGLVPFWTKRNPDYTSVLKTINCRDDSLASAGGMWASMKARKRCIVVAQGFYEWLQKGKEKVPHFVKRKDGGLMCFAGLWDVVQYEDDPQKHYTYTIITTDSNKQLRFLHDRMPVILDAGSDALRVWLDPARHEWSRELQALLKPFAGELEVYPVSKEVGKVGNNSPSFIVPVASRENKSNIANFFANASNKASPTKVKKKEEDDGDAKVKPEVEIKQEVDKADSSNDKSTTLVKTESVGKASREADDGGMEASPLPKGIKREADAVDDLWSPPAKKAATGSSPAKQAPSSPVKQTGRPKISSTSNGTANKSPSKAAAAAAAKAAGSQKITKFFANSS